jgi:hypothetical protein
MSAQPAFEPPQRPLREDGGRGLLAAALVRAEAWLLEPEESAVADVERVVGPRPVVAVFGLGQGCGATTVSRALGAELASRDPGGACAVSASTRSAALPLGSPAAARLARTFGALDSAWAQANGRLCLVDCGDLARLADAARYLAPLVLDGGHTAVGGAPAALADHVVLVASPRVEPALASVAGASLARVGPAPLLVLNRASGLGPFEGIAELLLPDSRMGAQLAHAGREPRGELGRAIAELADHCANLEADR